MSEPDDDTKPETEGDAKPQSLFDSGWDALLGPAPSSPTFSPPGVPAPSSPDVAPITAPATEPRTSGGGASVSGEFLAPDQPRPEPATPPRFEAPAGVSPNYDRDEDEWTDEVGDDVPGQFTAQSPEPDAFDDGDDADDDADDDTRGEAAAGDRDDDDDRDDRYDDDDDDRGESSAYGSIEASVTEGEGGLRSSLVLLTIAAVIVGVVVAVFVGKSRTSDELEQAELSKAKQADDQADRVDQAGQADRADQAPRKPQPAKPVTKPSLDELPSDSDGADELSDTETETEAGEAETETETGETETDPRDPSVIPPGTPEENAKAFTKLPVSIHDGPPVGGIGRSGVHVDAISMARGHDNTECNNPTRSFSAQEAEYVNVCFRVVHPREQESLRVIWEKDGKVTRRGRVRIPDLHAYTTRAYLLVRPEYLGSWRVRIVPEGEEDTDLAVAQFEITE